MTVLIVLVLGFAAFCVLFWMCGVYAAPVAVGLWTAFLAMNLGSGEIGGLALGAMVGIGMFLVAKIAFQATRSHFLRWTIGMVFAGPAGCAGFSIVQQTWPLVVSPTIWQYVVGVAIAAAFAATQ